MPSRCQAHSWNLQFSLLCEISHPISGTETQISKPIGRVLEETVVRVALKSQAHQNFGLICVKKKCNFPAFFLRLAPPFPGHSVSLLSPSSPASALPRGDVLKISNSTGLVAVAKACSDKAGWLRRSQHAPGCVCERTGQAATKKQLSQYCQNGKNKHFW